jgi:hypothetical protein
MKAAPAIVGGKVDSVDFERRLRALLPSIKRCEMRPSSSDLILSFGDQSDFFALIRSASGVNIPVETGWIFEERDPSRSAVSHCYLRPQLAENCLHDRLSFLLDDLAIGKADEAG